LQGEKKLKHYLSGKQKAAALLLCLIIIFTSACTNKKEKSALETPAAKETIAAVQSPTGSAEPAADPFSKYDKQIEVTTGSIVYPTTTYPEGDSLDNNVWTRLYEEKLGIKVKHTWTAPESQYQTKMTASIASNDIPDIMNVDEKFFKLYLDSNVSEDLTDAFEKYASDDLKALYSGPAGKANLDYARVNGRLMGLPAPWSGHTPDCCEQSGPNRGYVALYVKSGCHPHHNCHHRLIRQSL